MRKVDRTYKLYVMTHNQTGLKYLGQTIRDLSTYNGSGIYWNKHLKKHGKDIDKKVIFESVDMTAISEMGLYYSNLWNVVNAVESNGNKIWANEKPESGHGGSSPAIVKKVRETKIKNNTLESNPAIIAKIRETKKKNGTTNSWTDNSKQKMLKTRVELYGTTNLNSLDSIAKAMNTRAINGTLLDSEVMKEKIKNTKIKNNSFNPNNPTSIALRKETKNKTFIKRHERIIPLILELYNNGISKYKISKQLNTSYDVICTILRKNNEGLIWQEK